MDTSRIHSHFTCVDSCTRNFTLFFFALCFFVSLPEITILTKNNRYVGRTPLVDHSRSMNGCNHGELAASHFGSLHVSIVKFFFLIYRGRLCPIHFVLISLHWELTLIQMNLSNFDLIRARFNFSDVREENKNKICTTNFDGIPHPWHNPSTFRFTLPLPVSVIDYAKTTFI